MKLHSGFKAGCCKAPGFSRISAGSQQCSSDCLFETICRTSGTGCDSPRGAPEGCQTLLLSWSGDRWFSSPWPPQHCTMKGSAAGERGQLRPARSWGSTLSRRGKRHYPTVLSHLYGSVPTKAALCPDTAPDRPCYKCSRLVTLKQQQQTTSALDCTGMLPWKE